MSVEIRILRRGDERVLANIAPGVFNFAIDPQFSREFLEDSRHHLAVAIEDDGMIVGFASALHYVHPDKPPEMWIIEVGVAPPHQRRGVGKRLLSALLELGQSLGCGEAWVLTDTSNDAARRLYASAGAEVPRDQVMFTFKLK